MKMECKIFKLHVLLGENQNTYFCGLWHDKEILLYLLVYPN